MDSWPVIDLAREITAQFNLDIIARFVRLFVNGADE